MNTPVVHKSNGDIKIYAMITGGILAAAAYFYGSKADKKENNKQLKEHIIHDERDEEFFRV